MPTFHEFSASSLNVKIYAYSNTADWVEYRRVQQGVFFQAVKIIAAHLSQCIFPAMNLHVSDCMVVREEA